SINMISNDDNISIERENGSGLLQIIRYDSIDSNTMWIADYGIEELEENEISCMSTGESKSSHCMYLVQDENMNYYIRKDDVNSTKEKIGIVIETDNYDKILKYNISGEYAKK
ncbi:hypothetical protein IKE96_02440, partial [bacterium]|nr:hypothetical protein [bacterium]